MSGAAFLRVKKLKGPGIIAVAARHNKRGIQAELGAAGSIDPTRSHLNETLAGPCSAADVGQLAKDLMTEAGVTKLRKDAVMALEIVFSLPPGHAIDDRAYFNDCATWAGSYLGGVTLSVDIHHDEAQPHSHVLLLPLIDGRMSGSDLIGGKQKLMAMQKQFHLDVAARYGLSKAPARLAGASKQAAAQAVLKKMRETGDTALQSLTWPTIRGCIENDPGPFLQELGIELQVPKKRHKTMAQIFTSTGKGGKVDKDVKPIGFAAPEDVKPIGFAAPESENLKPTEVYRGAGNASQKKQTLCSVGFGQKTHFKTPAPATNEACEETQYQRLTKVTFERDDDAQSSVTNRPDSSSYWPADGHGIYRRSTARPANLFTNLIH